MEDWLRVDELHAIVFGEAPKPPHSSGALRYLFGLLLFGAGVLELISPRFAWQVFEGWRYRNLEPSDAHLLVSRLGGVFCICLALFLAFAIPG